MKKNKNFLWVIVFLMLFCLAWSGKAQAADNYQIRYHTTSKAYFLYKNGRVVKSDHRIVAKVGTMTVNGRTFQKGVYFAAPTGRVIITAGVVCLPTDCTVDGVTYRKGYYKTETNGRLASRSGIVEIRKTYGSKTYNGIYYYEKTGRMLSSPAVKKLNITYRGSTYSGYYYFAGKDCVLRGKTGLVNLNGAYYYVLSSGRCLTNQTRNVQGRIYLFGSTGVGRIVSVNMTTLQQRVTAVTSQYGGTWSVYVKKLDSGQTLTINNVPQYAASLIKPFLMATVYDQIRQNKLSETSAISTKLWNMITESSNDDTNELGQILGNGNFLAGAALVNSYNTLQGYASTALHHTMRPSTYDFVTDGQSNQTTVVDCGNLLEKIYLGTCVNGQSSQKMLNMLLNQQRRWKIPAGLPAGTKVANKTGEGTIYQHDIAIVYGPKCDYILCVMSTGVSETTGIQCVKEISAAVYNYLEK